MEAKERRFEVTCARSISYPVYINSSFICRGYKLFLERIAKRTVLVVTTPTVDLLYGVAFRENLNRAEARTRYEVICAREDKKNIENLIGLIELAHKFNLSRDSAIVAFGGGVCSDIVTLAASLIRRGISYITIPTTFVGQIDAGIAVKGAINYGSSKNYLGCFHPPEAVFIDPSFLHTLSDEQIRCGFAEAIKLSLIRDPHLFALIRKVATESKYTRLRPLEGSFAEIVSEAIRITLEELMGNIYETPPWRRILDFGHTFSPVLEACSNYRLPHGDAVAIDIALSASIATVLGILSDEDLHDITRTLAMLSLPIWSPLLTEELCAISLRKAQQHRGGDLNLVVLGGIGHPVFLQRTDFADRELWRALTCLAIVAQEWREHDTRSQIAPVV